MTDTTTTTLTVEQQQRAEALDKARAALAAKSFARHITTSRFLLADLQKARRQGRKTIRIDDLLAEAERKYAEFIDRYPEAAADCPCPSCVHEAGRRV